MGTPQMSADSSTSKMTRSGIYSIVSLVTGHTYVGQAVDIPGRWRSHRCLLRNGKHFNIRLQRAWDKEGESSFIFDVLEYTPRDAEALEKAEQFWADYQKACEKTLYNFGGFTRNPNFGRTFPEETRRKVGEASKRRGIPENFHARGRTPWNKGIKYSPELCAKISAAVKGCKMPPRTKEHISKLPQCQAGRKCTAEARQKMSDAGKRRVEKAKALGLKYCNQRAVICVETGKVYCSGREAARDLGLNSRLINLVVRGTRARTGGYTFRYFEADAPKAA